MTFDQLVVRTRAGGQGHRCARPLGRGPHRERRFNRLRARARYGLCGAAFGVLWTYDGERVHAAAVHGAPPAFEEFLTRAPHAVGPDNAHGRLLRGEPVVHIADVAQDTAY